jgi:hypothetical protein
MLCSGRFRSYDLWVMSPTRFLCATKQVEMCSSKVSYTLKLQGEGCLFSLSVRMADENLYNGGCRLSSIVLIIVSDGGRVFTVLVYLSDGWPCIYSTCIYMYCMYLCTVPVCMVHTTYDVCNKSVWQDWTFLFGGADPPNPSKKLTSKVTREEEQQHDEIIFRIILYQL